MIRTAARPGSMRFERRERAALLALVWLAWLLLVWRLGQRSLWIDEFNSLTMSRGTAGQVIAAALADFHPPAYFLGLALWTRLAGTSDFALRWPSAAAAAVSIPLLAVVARRWLGARPGLWAAGLLAVAPAFVEFSRMARYYSLVLCLGLAATALLQSALRYGQARRWLVYGLAALALLFTFYPAAFVLAGHALWVAWGGGRRRGARTEWVLTVGLVAVVFGLSLLNPLRAQAGHAAQTLAADFAHSRSGFLLSLAASAYTFSIGETIFPWHPVAWLGLAATALLLASAIARRAGPVFWLNLAAVAAGIVFVAAVVTLISVQTPFLNVPVRGLFLLPGYAIALAAALRCQAGRWRAGLAAALVGPWLFGLFNYFAGQQYLNPIYLTPAREAAAYVGERAGPADLVISDGDSLVARYLDIARVPAAQADAGDVEGVQAALAVRPARVWYIWLGRDRTRAVAPDVAVHQLLAEGYDLDATQELLPMDETYWRLKSRVLGRESYRYRLTIETYHRRAP